MLEHLGFPAKPQLEHRHVCEAIFTVEKWQFVPGAPLLPLANPVEDELVDDHPVEDQSPPAMLTEEPQIPVSTAPSVTVPLPASHASSTPPMPPIPSDSARPSTSAPSVQSISKSSHAFLAIMDAVRTFSATSTSFAAAHTALAERMAHAEAAIAQTTTILKHNNAILLQIQSHLGLPQTSPSVHAQVSLAPTAAAALGHPA